MHEERGVGASRRILVHVAMSVIGILLIAFSAWVVYLIYFKGAYRANKALTRSTISRQAMIYEPFHGVEDSVLAGSRSMSWCLKCHEDLPHSKSKEVRGMLNAHSFFLACEACHIAPQVGERFEYRWLQRASDKPLASLNGPPGDYGGTIVPFKWENGVARRLDENPQALQLLDESALVDNDGDMKRRTMRLNADIHREFSSKPLFCDDCHRANGALDFGQLMYPPHRVERLTIGEGANVIKQYREFYLPSFERSARDDR